MRSPSTLPEKPVHQNREAVVSSSFYSTSSPLHPSPSCKHKMCDAEYIPISPVVQSLSRAPAALSLASHSPRNSSIALQHSLPSSSNASRPSAVNAFTPRMRPFLVLPSSSPTRPPYPHPSTSVRVTRSSPQKSVLLPHFPGPLDASMASRAVCGARASQTGAQAPL